MWICLNEMDCVLLPRRLKIYHQHKVRYEEIWSQAVPLHIQSGIALRPERMPMMSMRITMASLTPIQRIIRDG